jgi:hypothetical protein
LSKRVYSPNSLSLSDPAGPERYLPMMISAVRPSSELSHLQRP